MAKQTSIACLGALLHVNNQIKENETEAHVGEYMKVSI